MTNILMTLIIVVGVVVIMLHLRKIEIVIKHEAETAPIKTNSQKTEDMYDEKGDLKPEHRPKEDDIVDLDGILKELHNYMVDED